MLILLISTYGRRSFKKSLDLLRNDNLIIGNDL